jgi:hypothetical protein
MGSAGRGLLLSVIVTGIVLLGGGCANPRSEPQGKPTTALILVFREGKLVRTHRLTDDKDVAAVEAFFPGYQKHPASDTAEHWKWGYLVYLDFARGVSVRLAVSPANREPASWTAGWGDFPVEGDFHAFVAGLAR